MENLPFSCGICSKTFGQSRSLAAHMKAHSDVNPYKCGICHRGFFKLSALTEHIKLHSTDKSFQCHLCSCSFQQSTSLNKHLTTHSRSKECCSAEINCSCIQLTNNCNITEHSDQLHTSIQDKCFPHNKEPSNLSSGSNNISNAIIATQFSVISSEEFRCQVCFQNFNNTVLLNDHMKIHSDNKSFACDVCGKIYTDSVNLAQHIRGHNGDKIFECDICHKVFSQASNLMTHKRTHSGERPFQCVICHKGFTESGNLRRHMRTHSGEKPFSCNICGKSFSQSSHVVKHRGTHFKTINFKAKKLNKKLCHKNKGNSSAKTSDNVISDNHGRRKGTKGKLKLQAAPLNVIKIRSPSGKLMYKCAVCGRVFKESGNLSRHLRVHTGEKPFNCSICSKTFSQATHVNKHMRTHKNNNISPFSCEICFKGFTKIDGLFEHMKIHSSSHFQEQENVELVPAYMENPPVSMEVTLDTDVIVYAKMDEGHSPPLPEFTVLDQIQNPIGEDSKEACVSGSYNDVDVCSDKQCLDLNAVDSNCSLNPDIMTQDMKSIAPVQSTTINPSEVNECNTCHKTFTQSSLLIKHKCRPLNQKPYYCNTCGKAFTEAGNLSRHMRIHAGIRPYKCTVCNKDFSQATHLHKHMNMHTVSKPYMCQVCQKSFKKQIDLNKHMENHIKAASFKCHICDKVFTERCNLESHLQDHSDQPPFQCNVCQMSFFKSSLFNKHKKTHLGDRPFKCDLCGKGFTESGNLTRHLRIHTGEKPYSCKVCGKAFSQTSHVNKHMKTHKEVMNLFVDNVCGSYVSSCNSNTSNLTVKDDVIVTETVNATSQNGSALLSESLLPQYSDISRYARFFADSELCQCTNCYQTFTVSQYTDHITACLASNLAATVSDVSGMRINEAEEVNTMTKEKSKVDMKPDVTTLIDNVQTNVLEQCKSIFTESDYFSDVINSYCSRNSKIHIKTEVV